MYSILVKFFCDATEFDYALLNLIIHQSNIKALPREAIDITQEAQPVPFPSHRFFPIDIRL